MIKGLIICPLILLVGCSYIANKTGYEKIERAQAKVEKVKQEAAAALTNKESEIRNQLGTVIEKQQDQMQSAANSLYGAGIVRPFFKEETRPLLIVYNRIDEAKAAIGLAPTLKAMEEEQKRLVNELDETKTSLAQLKATHDQKVKENEELVTITNQEKEKVIRLEAEKKQMESDFALQIQATQNEVIKEQQKTLAAEKINSEKTKYIESNKRLLMISLGGISVVALIIAIYLPLYKKESFTLAGVTGGIALCVPFLQPVHFAIVFGLGITLGLLVFARKMKIGTKVNENLINAIQEYKETQPEKYKALKPLLEEYNKKYQGGDKVEDKDATKHIEEILKDYEKI